MARTKFFGSARRRYAQMSESSTVAGPKIEARNVSKYFGRVIALENVSIAVPSGEVHCVLGDNGAGKSTLIKMLCGYLSPDAGDIFVDGERVVLDSPRAAGRLGIATVYQDLALFPMMSIVRNFIVGKEITRGRLFWKRVDWPRSISEATRELSSIGISLRDSEQVAGTLSGGERQSLAIARAEHRGATVLILDEPTSALGVNQARNVLYRVQQAAERGVAIILITHNPLHALLIGDRFTVLAHGRVVGRFNRGEVDTEELQRLMAGGAELRELEKRFGQVTPDQGISALHG
jgi:simple sugar transport system ATP-binding protein